MGHNGSVVYLVANGSTREFYYDKPRPGMIAVGAQPGSLLFRGESIDGRYVGTAYIFNSRCGQLPYEVSGPIQQTHQKVILIGRAPRVGVDCRFTGYIDQTLEFTYLNSDETPVPIEGAAQQTIADLNGVWQPITKLLDDRALTIHASADRITISAPDLSCTLTEMEAKGAASITASDICDDESYTSYGKTTLTVFRLNGQLFLVEGNVSLRTVNQNVDPIINEVHNNEPATIYIYGSSRKKVGERLATCRSRPSLSRTFLGFRWAENLSRFRA